MHHENTVIYPCWLQDVAKMFCLLWQSQIKVSLYHWLALRLQARCMSILSSPFLVLQNEDTNTYLWGYDNIMCCVLNSFSHVRLFETLWTVATVSPSICHEVMGPDANTLATWCEELTHLKRPWYWERLKSRGEGDDRGWDGWMASLTQWTCVWVNSGSWRWTGRSGGLQSMGSQRVRHDWSTGLNCNRPGPSVHGDSPGKNTGVGYHFLLQGIFPTQGWNPSFLGLLHWPKEMH